MEILDQPLENSRERIDFDVIPTATAAYGHAKTILKERFVDLLLVSLVVMALSGFAGIASIFAVLISIPMSYGASYVYLKAIRGEDFEVADVFDGFKQYKDVIISGILSGLIVGLGFLLLFIPGIIASIRLSFVPYLVMDKKMDGVEAIKESWEMTKGFGGEIFVYGVLAVLIILGGLLLLGVGIIPASMWISAAMATLYQSVDSINGKEIIRDDDLVN